MNNLLREMQEEFRNSQFINIYFHKFAPSRLFFPWLALDLSPFPPPPAPPAFADPVSPTASLLVSARGSDRRPFSASVPGGGGAGVCFLARVSLFSISAA